MCTHNHSNVLDNSDLYGPYWHETRYDPQAGHMTGNRQYICRYNWLWLRYRSFFHLRFVFKLYFCQGVLFLLNLVRVQYNTHSFLSFKAVFMIPNPGMISVGPSLVYELANAFLILCANDLSLLISFHLRFVFKLYFCQGVLFLLNLIFRRLIDFECD